MNKLLFAAALAAAFVLGNRGSAVDKDAKDKPKLDIEAIMEKAHEGEAKSLRNRVISGKAEKKDAEELLSLYTELSKNDPPKGDKAAWKKKTAIILVAAKKVAVNPKDAASLGALEKATACAACHKEHKP
jgi:hypothetical protein